ncbi:MAG: hypothetical protein WC593_13835 [Methanoregula sp.]
MNDLDFLSDLKEKISGYVRSLEDPLCAGHFYPMDPSQTPKTPIALGYSCFALKTLYTINEWEKIPELKRQQWINYIKSFQIGTPTNYQQHYEKNAFIDPPVVDYLLQKSSVVKKITRILLKKPKFGDLERTIYAETKQAIATLHQVGEHNDHIYTSFPTELSDLYSHLISLNWREPWGAGGQAAALAVFIKTEAPRFLGEAEVQALSGQISGFFGSLADPVTGAYYINPKPNYGQMINGAMKVLTALDWLEERVHYPEQLIDTCLSQMPSSEGCHLVDAVYVLHRCNLQTDYKKQEIREYCTKILHMIQLHQNKDGGFSYHIGKTQNWYYGVHFPQKTGISDLHGTCLLTWAVAMLDQISEERILEWEVIRP